VRVHARARAALLRELRDPEIDDFYVVFDACFFPQNEDVVGLQIAVNDAAP